MRERVVVLVLSVCLLTADLEGRCVTYNGQNRHEHKEDDISPFKWHIVLFSRKIKKPAPFERIFGSHPLI